MTTNAGIKIDKPYSLQRFQLDVTAVDNRYDTNSALNFTALNYRAAWLWQLTPNISGIISADRQQTLNSFSDFRDNTNQLNTGRSIATNQSRRFNVDALIGGGWHILGGLSDLSSQNSQTFNAVGNFVQDGIEFGVKYAAPSDNAITLMHRESRGNFQGRNADVPAQLDTGYNQSETEAILDWQLTGNSVINAHLGYIDREHDHFSSRDFDGVKGRLAYNWTPTDKLHINTSISRNLYSYQQNINSYYVDDTFSIEPTWQITAKTKMRLHYDYSKRDYFGAIVPIAENRKDDVQTFLVSAEWQALRTLTVIGTLQHETRSSNATLANGLNGPLDYDVNSVTISAQLLF